MVGMIIGVITMCITRIYLPAVLRGNGILFGTGVIVFMLGFQADRKIPAWVTLLSSAVGIFMLAGFFPGNH